MGLTEPVGVAAFVTAVVCGGVLVPRGDPIDVDDSAADALPDVVSTVSSGGNSAAEGNEPPTGVAVGMVDEPCGAGDVHPTTTVRQIVNKANDRPHRVLHNIQSPHVTMTDKGYRLNSSVRRFVHTLRDLSLN